MSDLAFAARLTWQGTVQEGGGSLAGNGQALAYAVPGAMRGMGRGATRADLLVWAVGSCYCVTLANLLRAARLPAASVAVRAEGLVTGYPAEGRFARITVRPAIEGADCARPEVYRDAAVEARDRCFIGRAIRGDVAYEVGEVTV
jgi:organic hydroperoxide reductase OsmC/OhrA